MISVGFYIYRGLAFETFSETTYFYVIVNYFSLYLCTTGFTPYEFVWTKIVDVLNLCLKIVIIANLAFWMTSNLVIVHLIYR